MASSADRVLALCSVVQSASLVTAIARTGMAPVDAVETCVQSLFATNPTTLQDIFDHGDKLRLGRRRLRQAWTEPDPEDPQIMLMVNNLIILTTRFTKTESHMHKMGLGITELSAQLSTMNTEKQQADDFIFQSFADLYQQWLSSLQPRIIVRGVPQHLQNASNLCKIRTLLLAGVRGTMLWQQLGGRRWHLFFKRKAILDEIKLN
jgi:high frequency lysogenization protein